MGPAVAAGGAGPAPGEWPPITRITRAARWAAGALAGLGVRKLAEAVMVVLTVVLGQPMLGAHGWDQFRRHAQIIRTLTRRSPAPAAQSAGKAFALWDGRVAVVPGHRCSRAAGLDTG